MKQQAPLEGANHQRRERRPKGRTAPLLGAVALLLTACDLFSPAGNLPTPAPIVFNTPTSYIFPTDTPIQFQTVVPTAADTATPELGSTSSPTEQSTETPSYAVTDTPTAVPAVTPEPTETLPPTSTAIPVVTAGATPTPERSTGRLEVEATGTYTYANYYDSNSRGSYLEVGQTVVARCVLFVQNPSDAGEIDAWYRLDSPGGPNGETLYAAADTFTNSGAQQVSGSVYDPNLAVCSDSPLPPQQP